MSYEIHWTDEASEHLVEAVDWWERNRQDSPTLLFESIEQLEARLGETPNLGVRHQLRDGRIVYQRLVMKAAIRANFHLYWEIDEENKIVTILALWHARAGLGPRFTPH